MNDEDHHEQGWRTRSGPGARSSSPARPGSARWSCPGRSRTSCSAMRLADPGYRRCLVGL